MERIHGILTGNFLCLTDWKCFGVFFWSIPKLFLYPSQNDAVFFGFFTAAPPNVDFLPCILCPESSTDSLNPSIILWGVDSEIWEFFAIALTVCLLFNYLPTQYFTKWRKPHAIIVYGWTGPFRRLCQYLIMILSPVTNYLTDLWNVADVSRALHNFPSFSCPLPMFF